MAILQGHQAKATSNKCASVILTLCWFRSCACQLTSLYGNKSHSDVHHGGPGVSYLAQPGRDKGCRQSTLSRFSHKTFMFRSFQTEAWSRGQRRLTVHHAGAGCAGSPLSASVPQRTAGQSAVRRHRRSLQTNPGAGCI